MRPRAPRHESGFAIILVLWLLVLLAAIGMHLIGSGRSELNIALNAAAAARAEALADGGIARAVFALADGDPERRWQADGQPHRLTIGGGDRLTIAVRNENSKVNPNLASEALMAALLRQVGVEQQPAAVLAAVIAARVRPSGSSAAPRPSSTSTPGVEQRSRLFGSIDELLEIPGMTADVLAALRPHISVYATAPVPAPDGADPVVSRAMAEAQPAAGTDNRTRGPQSGTEKMVVSILSRATGPSGADFPREAVVRLESGAPKGYVVLHWSRGETEGF